MKYYYHHFTDGETEAPEMWVICPRFWDGGRAPVPYPTLKFPHSLCSYKPRPHPIPPASSRASPPGLWPTVCRPSPASPVRIWGLRDPRRVTPTCQGGVRRGTDLAWRCSAYDWLRVPWAGLGKKGTQLPRPLFTIICSIPGALQEARVPGTG